VIEWKPGPAWLFCPADRPDRYAKALERSDVVILDLEDAVAPDRKRHARDSLSSLAAKGLLDVGRTVVRVNDAASIEHAADLTTVARIGVEKVMLAKAERPQDIQAIEAHVIPLVETPRGLEHVGSLAAPDNVVGLMWGADDLVAGLGGTSSRHVDGTYRDIARFARSRTLVAAKAAGRLALDGVHMDIPDLDGLRSECADAVAVGFDATVAIHPSQVSIIRECYLPDSDQVEWARRLLAHVGSGASRGVTTFEGRMVDGPVYRQAERVLARATAATEPADG
jgi:citrate lyase subunit beta/citryl-CoA lyase